MTLHVVYSSDNNYAQHVGVSMVSLFENNKEFDHIHVYLIQNAVSLDNKSKLEEVCKKYKRTITFIGFDEISAKLNLNIGNTISLNAYARLFLTSALENTIDKIIYFDCDSIINGSLHELWHTDISDHYVAGVCDTVSDNTKIKINMHIDRQYINSGMLLINLKKWREDEIERRFIEFISAHHGQVFHHDQGTINGVLNDKFVILHPKYNAMTTYFTMSRNEIIQYYGLRYYYSEAELVEAVNNPVFIHYTPAFVNRPWIKGCKHPLAARYHDYLKISPWKESELGEDKRKVGEKFVAYLYNHFPFPVARGICNLIFK
ncbi:glycosyltransferase family 8 protein [Paenibacillus sp. GCM10023248]|uniref:glycosyltransferase family 8 protein n=1 Tax=unclassified Paenibacillus TaxID=185978 RepID=UPI0023796A94|nr:glycosyltransferase family 8 protein [Paenibacillus sp. MAHUQ-63]MDD9266531.1 glycosyltransferase family 8 protein [Paenibacillus sp. MAHUQ-63]